MMMQPLLLDLPTATAADRERQALALQLRAAAPLRGRVDQHAAAVSPLFAAGAQRDLFGTEPTKSLGKIPAEVLADFAEADADSGISFAGSKGGWSDEQRAAWDRAWDRNKRAYARGAAAEAAGEVEVMGWGAGDPAKKMVFGKPGYRLCVWNDYGRWRYKRSLNLHNSGASSPYSDPFPSREAAMLDAFRCVVRAAAQEAATADAWPDRARRAKELAQLSRWCCEQLPPLLCGVDLAAELRAAIATTTEREKLRRTAIGAGKQTYTGEDGRERSIYSL